jgi:hypothetical protein
MNKILLILFLFITTILANDIGTITAFKGKASIKRDNVLIPLTLGTKLQEKDEIITENRTKVQIIFKDETIITIGKNSNFSINDYFYEEANSKPRAEFGIFRGAMRTITGQIGKIAPKKFKVITKTSSIGIRGTNFTVSGNRVYCTYGAIDVTIRSTGVNVLVKQGFFVQINTDGTTTLQEYSAEDIEEVSNEEFSDAEEEKDDTAESEDKEKDDTAENEEKEKSDTTESDDKEENDATTDADSDTAENDSTTDSDTGTTDTAETDTEIGFEDSDSTADIITDTTDPTTTVAVIEETTTDTLIISNVSETTTATTTATETTTATTTTAATETTTSNAGLTLSIALENSVSNSASSGTTVATATATDSDGSGITYSLTNNSNGYLAIDSSTGVVTLTAAGATYAATGADLPDVTVSASSTTGSTSTGTATLSVPDTSVGRYQLHTDATIDEVGRVTGSGTSLVIKNSIASNALTLSSTTSSSNSYIIFNGSYANFKTTPESYIDMENFSFSLQTLDGESPSTASGALNEFKTVSDLDETDDMSWGELNFDNDQGTSIRELWVVGTETASATITAFGTNSYIYTYSGKWRAYVDSTLSSGDLNLKFNFGSNSGEIVFKDIVGTSDLTFSSLQLLSEKLKQTGSGKSITGYFGGSDGLSIFGSFYDNTQDIKGVFQANEALAPFIGKTSEGGDLALTFNLDKTTLLTGSSSYFNYTMTNDDILKFIPLEATNVSTTSFDATIGSASSNDSVATSVNSSSFKTVSDSISNTDYVSWGTWNASIQYAGATKNYTNQYWVGGESTPTSVVNALTSTSVDYSGSYIGDAVSGSAAMNVNFGADTATLTINEAVGTNISTFGMTLSGNTLSGSQTDSGGGGTATGIFYGPNAESIGGHASVEYSGSEAKVVYQVGKQ